MSSSDIEAAFPFSSFREYQREILEEAKSSLFENPRTNIVVIDAPTGIGKSGINVALCNMARDAFYTTPQKQLRQQLEDDEDLYQHYRVLRARDDYACDVGTSMADSGTVHTCLTCPINNNSEESCRDYGCRYWTAKEAAMKAHTAVITFAYLIVDNYLPVMAFVPQDEGQSTLGSFAKRRQVSFSDRDLLIVDEAHALEEQVASLHAGFTLSRNTLEFDRDDQGVTVTAIYQTFRDAVSEAAAEFDDLDDMGVSDLLPAIAQTSEMAREYIKTLHEQPGFNEEEAEMHRFLENLLRKIDRLMLELDEGRDWVVAVEDRSDKQEPMDPAARLKPVKVDKFLKDFVWSRADNVVLSTATIPYRNAPSVWLRRIGLDPDLAEVISKPMPFDVDQRKVHVGTIVGKMSRGREDAHWDEVVEVLERIRDKHRGQKGLVHTVSYDRARRLYDYFSDSAILHEDDRRPDEFYINQWQKSDKQMLLTPSMMDGVDLPDDKCRWQVLVKVPYPHASDPRVEHLLDEKKDWEWYMDVTSREVIQSVGRAVRSKEDYADYYVLDASFKDVMENRAPDWFVDAFDEGDVR